MFFKLRQLVFCLMFVGAFLAVADGHAKNDTQAFTLPPVDGEPHTVQIPVKISRSGTISATVKLTIDGLLAEKTIYVSLYQKNNRYPLKAEYVSRLQGLHLRHKVEKNELSRGGDYYLTLTNYSHEKVVTGKVELSFPVAGETEFTPGGGPLPNLAVIDLSLNDRCKVLVGLKNLGPGSLPTNFWKMNMPELKLFKDGQEWGGVDIRFFDYNQALSPVGGETVYVTGLKVIGSARIKAKVLQNVRFRDDDATDNVREIVLTCK